MALYKCNYYYYYCRQLVDMRKLLRAVTVDTVDLGILDTETREALEDTRVGVDIKYDDFITQVSVTNHISKGAIQVLHNTFFLKI